MEGRRDTASCIYTESAFLDVKPLRTLIPLFPTPLGYTRFAALSIPLHPIPETIFDSSSTHEQPLKPDLNSPNAPNGVHFDSSVQDLMPTPCLNDFVVTPNDSLGTSKKKQKRKLHKKILGDAGIAQSLLDTDGDRQTVERVLMIFDGLRRRLTQIDDLRVINGAPSRQPALEAGGVLFNNNIRANAVRRVGAIPGIEVGDIFYFRVELCLVGLHYPNMAGIDYMNVKFGEEEESVAISIVSSGLHKDDETSDTDSLIYTGQGGGITKSGQQSDDQKLERGNLAMERSTHRGNDIRVIRSMSTPTSKVYIYDGLYKIQDAWLDKGKAGFNIFKYKLGRLEGQPKGIAMWKQIHQWRSDLSSREGVILPDLSSGAEKVLVVLVNEVDWEKGPAHFAYISKVSYPENIGSMGPPLQCSCSKTCNPGDESCDCRHQNGGHLPYTSNGLLVNRKPLIRECGSCSCSISCRNRVSQKGINIQFEVFKTRDKGWGLRSCDPIRAGSFICEYVGDVICAAEARYIDDEDNDYIFEDTCLTGTDYFKWNIGSGLLEENKLQDCYGTYKALSICINAKGRGNVARFMNHSCSPNALWQPVLYDNDNEQYPHIMFFALKHIPPMQELTYDYGLRSDDHRRKKCLCNSSNCRGSFG